MDSIQTSMKWFLVGLKSSLQFIRNFEHILWNCLNLKWYMILYTMNLFFNKMIISNRRFLSYIDHNLVHLRLPLQCTDRITARYFPLCESVNIPKASFCFVWHCQMKGFRVFSHFWASFFFVLIGSFSLYFTFGEFRTRENHRTRLELSSHITIACLLSTNVFNTLTTEVESRRYNFCP